MHSYAGLPPLECLTALLVAARTGSFTAAAEELGLTHGSVSRRIGLIETWLGTPIFERHGRGVRLTPAGQRFAAEAERSLSAIARSADRWRPTVRQTPVRLSVIPSFARLWLLSRLPRILSAAMDVRVELAIEHRVADLKAPEADIAIRYGRGEWPGVRVRLLFKETLVPVAAPELAARILKNTDAANLLSTPLLHDSDAGQWRAWLAAEGIRYRPRTQDRRFEDYDTVLMAAEAGLGVALLRAPLALAWLEKRRLAIANRRRIQNTAAHYVVTRLNEDSDRVIKLADQLLTICAHVD
jgi:LysR family transcriptional regulator, glycine cleavage system transcriptional activator